MRVLANSCISDSPKTTFVIKIDTACARLIRKLHKHYGKYCRRFPVQCKEMQINRDFPLRPLSLTRASSRRSSGIGLRRCAPFPFALPRVILRKNAKARPAVAERLFSCTSVPYERELSTVHWHTKKAQPNGCAFTFFRDPDRIRTCDPQLRRLLLYPAELLDQTSIFGVGKPTYSESGCKDSEYFLICNNFWFYLLGFYS